MDDKSRSRLAATLEKVISTEVSLRTGDLNLVEQNINTVREYLNKLRQGVCADYYDDNFKTTLQKPPHRAVKNTFKGKTPIKQEMVDSGEDSASTSYNSRSQVHGERQNPLAEGFSQVTVKEEPADDYADGSNSFAKKDEPHLKYIDPQEKLRLSQEAEKRRPRYIPPILPINQIQQSLEPRGNRLMKKIRFLVRNNSKYIMTPEDSSGCTYKWSLNVKLNDESCDISDIVSKVIFYLHPSYKPNDVITLTSAPFKITRRGWGEFNLRVKIFFIHEKDEPVDITHQLVFDKLCSGIETFGGETVFDHWIIDPASRIQNMAAPKGCNSLTPSDNNLQNKTIVPSKKSPTVMNTDESSSSLLSAFFGELEEQSTKKDSEWGQDIFELSNLAFPEFFSSPGKSSSENVSITNSVTCKQVSLPSVQLSPRNEHVVAAEVDRSPVTDAATTEVAPEKIEVEVIHDSEVKIEMNENLVIEDKCGNSEVPIDEFPRVLSSEIVNKQVVDSADLQPKTVTEGAGKEELYLSDLSTFDDEVVITESVGCVENPSETTDTNQLDHKSVDYNSVEIDELIHFGEKSKDGISQPIASTSSSVHPLNTVVGNNTSQTLLVTDVKQNRALCKSLDSESPQSKKATPKNSPDKKTSATGPKLLLKPPPTDFQKPPHLRPIAPSLPGQLPLPLSAVLAHLPPPPKNKGSVVYVVAPTGTPKSAPSQVVPAQNVLTSRVVSKGPHTLLVSSSELPNMLATQKCTPTLVMTSPKGARTPVVPRVNPKKSITLPSPPVGVPQSSAPSSTQGPKPTLIKADGKPVPLVNITSHSTGVPVPNSSMLVQSLRACSQATTVPVVPSMRPSPMGAQCFKPPTPIRPNLTVPPKSKAILVRPGGTQFLLKMPDGSLKPIKMESLKPLQQGNLKLRIAASSSQRPVEQKLPEPPPLVSKEVLVQKRRPVLIRNVPPVKRSRLPTPETMPAIPGSSKQQRHVLVSPSSSSHHPNQFTKLHPGMGLPSKPRSEKCHDDAADPEPQGMNSLKRRPPETEFDTSSFRNERILIEQCPKESIQVAVTFLLKNLPLFDARSPLDGFKQAFPYCAPDRATFRSWPFAKQRAHEVLRANDVLNLTKQALVTCSWTKWDIVRFARLRGFTPLTGKIDTSFLPHKPLDVFDPPTDAAFNSLVTLFAPDTESDDELDVDTVIEGEPEPCDAPVVERLNKKGKVFMTLARHVEDGSVVERWVQDASIYLDPEELAPGILFPAALRLLVSAFHSFAEDLLRRSYSSAFLRYESSEPRVMVVQDVRLALRSRPEFDLFTNVGLGVKYRQPRPKIEDPNEEDRRLRKAEKVS